MRNCEAERLGRLHIDYEFELGRLLHRQVDGLLALEDTSDIIAGLTHRVGYAGAVAHEATCCGLLAQCEGCGNPITYRQCRDLVGMAAKECIAGNKKRGGVLLSESQERIINLTLGARLQENEFQPERARGLL